MADGKLDRLQRRLEEIHKEELEDEYDSAGVAVAHIAPGGQNGFFIGHREDLLIWIWGNHIIFLGKTQDME